MTAICKFCYKNTYVCDLLAKSNRIYIFLNCKHSPYFFQYGLISINRIGVFG
jgi:hypothetical protein